MALFDFYCEPCDYTFERVVFNGTMPRCPKCTGWVKKLPSTAKLIKIDGVNPSIRKNGEGTAPYYRG